MRPSNGPSCRGHLNRAKLRPDQIVFINCPGQVGLVGWKMKDDKTKLYHLERPRIPQAAVIVLGQDDIRSKSKEFRALIAALSAIEGEEIPRIDEIESAEICFHYSRSDE